VVLQAIALGHLPYVSLILGLSFAGYGIVRKWVSASAQTGLLIECLVLAPVALAFLAWLQVEGGGVFTGSASAALWLIAAGPMTAAPLALFAWSARRLPFSALGFMQFVGPTTGFAIGIAQGEPFTPLRALSFVFIWGGAAVFVWSAWRASRKSAATETVASAEPRP
jgi:chloramphenicol-sensitive protein RarD